MKKQLESLTFRDAYLHERRGFGQVRPGTKTIPSRKEKARNRQVMRQQDRKQFAQY